MLISEKYTLAEAFGCIKISFCLLLLRFNTQAFEFQS